MKMLRKIIDGKSLEISRETSMMDFHPVKLQTYSVQTATLLLRKFITDTFLKMYRTLAVLKK